ncbi:MAG: DMT family transporter [Acidimicrobiia bacterium]
MTLAIVLSLFAAFLFAAASVLQQRGTEGIADDDALGAGMIAALVRRPIWVLGITADIAGFGVQAAALAVGSLLLVQPLLVTTLLFALPMAARVAHRRLTEQEWRSPPVCSSGCRRRSRRAPSPDSTTDSSRACSPGSSGRWP